MRKLHALLALIVTASVLLIAGCFGSDNSPAAIHAALQEAGLLVDGTLPDGFMLPDVGVPVYTVGGTVIGLQGSGLVLEGDQVEDITVGAAGGAPVAFSFPTAVPTGTPYSIVVKTQPTNPSQTCAVTTPPGTVGDAGVSTVVVSCTTNNYAVGGTITGLLGSGLLLANNGGDSLLVPAGATSFVFGTSQPSGSPYAVTVVGAARGPSQTCTVVQPTDTGTVTNRDVTSVQIACTTNTYTVGGTVVGLQGTGLVLQDNGADDLTINVGGKFAFSRKVASGGQYAVTIKTQPGNPSQTCTLSGRTGVVAGGAVTSVVVNCSTGTFSVGGTVSGLVGTGLVLSSTTGGSLTINGNGTFAFPPVAAGTGYTVMVATQPNTPPQSCTLVNGSGTVTTHDVTDVTVTCTGFLVGGTVTGLGAAGQQLVLLNNGGDNLQVTSDGAFTFPTLLADNSGYAVTVGTQPSNRICSVVANGVGTIAGADVTNVTVRCIPRDFPVQVSIALTGCGGTGVITLKSLDFDGGVLGSQPVALSDFGDAGGLTVTLPPQLPTGATYDVTINGDGFASCSFSNDSSEITGTVGTAPVQLSATCNTCF